MQAQSEAIRIALQIAHRELCHGHSMPGNTGSAEHCRGKDASVR
jgi:hypothetical protein